MFFCFHLVKNMFSPVGFKGNLSLLDIYIYIFHGTKKQMEVCRWCLLGLLFLFGRVEREPLGVRVFPPVWREV